MTGPAPTPTPVPRFVQELVGQLRRRGLPLGVDDADALRLALSAGFGWSSSEALRDLCVALWAKSAAEAETVRAAFLRVDPPEWDTADRPAPAPGPALAAPPAPGDRPATSGPAPAPDPPASAAPAGVPVARELSGLPLAPPRTGRPDRSLVLTAQYPVTERQVVQTWRGLRRATRHGPPVELDLAATLDRYARTGVVTAPVLVPARRNTTRLLVLVDRHGSMAPFHGYVDHVCRAVAQAGRLSWLAVSYFHNAAGRSPDRTALAELPDPFSPAIDAVLDLVTPLPDGQVYDDPDLTVPRPLGSLLSTVTGTTGAVVVSDAGAARGSLNLPRLLDTVAFAKALRAAAGPVAWLNPVPPARWRRTTAGQLARHVPMFPLTRAGMYRAVDVLRGRPVTVERPV